MVPLISVRDALGRGIGDVVHRQDDDVVADAEAAVRAAVAQQLHLFGLAPAQREPLGRLGDDLRRGGLLQAPAHRLQVVRVDVSAPGDRLHDLADGPAVLEQLVPDRHVAHGDLVTQRHVVDVTVDSADLLPFQRDDADLFAGLQVAHRHADIIDEFRGSGYRVTCMIPWLVDLVDW